MRIVDRRVGRGGGGVFFFFFFFFMLFFGWDGDCSSRPSERASSRAVGRCGVVVFASFVVFGEPFASVVVIHFFIDEDEDVSSSSSSSPLVTLFCTPFCSSKDGGWEVKEEVGEGGSGGGVRGGVSSGE